MNEFGKVAVASFPRSGNTFMRSILEKVTGIFTGSDIVPVGMELDIVDGGLYGGSVVDERAWFFKSHYPDGPAALALSVNKVIPLGNVPTLYFRQSSWCGTLSTR